MPDALEVQFTNFTKSLQQYLFSFSAGHNVPLFDVSSSAAEVTGHGGYIHYLVYPESAERKMVRH